MSEFTDFVARATAGGTECVEWPGYRNARGYGVRNTGPRPFLVHRLVWEHVNGSIPEGLHVLHTCDNPPCARLSHLHLGTDADNVADMMSRGRHYWLSRSQCSSGHPYTDDNTRVEQWQTGQRVRRCMTCARGYELARQHRRRAEWGPLFCLACGSEMDAKRRTKRFCDRNCAHAYKKANA